MTPLVALLALWLLISCLTFAVRTLMEDPKVVVEHEIDYSIHFYHTPGTPLNKFLMFPVYLIYGLVPYWMYGDELRNDVGDNTEEHN